MPIEPVTKRGRATRDRIVAAADALVAERGVEGASLDQILATADASKSQLYHYFTGKGALVRAVIARRRDLVLESQMPVLAELDSWPEAVHSHRLQGAGVHPCRDEEAARLLRSRAALAAHVA